MLPAGGNPEYYAEDFLGSSRVTTQNNGTVCYDADFYPYGGERAYTNSCPSANGYKFEGKERDTETGNDDFGARYYSNRFGRWLSADWSSVPVAVPYANLTNPQTLNLYSMVADDPESFADLDGHGCYLSLNGGGGINCSGDTWLPYAKTGEGNGAPGNSGVAATPAASGAEMQLVANQQANQNTNQQQAGNGGQISLTLGDTKVAGEYSFGGIGQLGPDSRPMLGAVVDANAIGCTNCFWVQTIENTGEKQKTDVPPGSNSPLYVTAFTSQGNYHDTPSREKGLAGASTLVTILGATDPKKETFNAKGAMTYGYSVDKQGKVTGSAPRLATKQELRQALAVVRREYPEWKIK
jgi:RHS repeat-associated protein